MRNNMKKKQSGQTLLEAIIALSTAVIILSAMTVIILSSLNNAQFSRNQNQATQYAQQGIEFLKNQSQYNWATFSSYGNVNYCFSQDGTTPTQKPALPGCAQSPYIINGLFVREVTINQYAAGNTDASCPPTSAARALVTVSVGWSDNKCSATSQYCHKVKLISCIYKSTSIPTP